MPLSLVIFEGLSTTITKAKRIEALFGVNMGRDLNLSHFLFVDDALLFIKGSLREARKLKEILDLYKSTTGMEVNLY
jgi:hypothetical protein